MIAPIFRAATEADADVIFSFLQELAEYEGRAGQVKLSQDALSAALRDGTAGIRAILCETEGTPAGFALWGERFSPYAGGTNMLLIDLYVRPGQRGAGLGKAFLTRLRDIAIEKDYVRIEWFVDAQNDEAKKFYSRMGGTFMPHSEHWKLDL